MHDVYEHSQVIMINMKDYTEYPFQVSVWRANEISKMNDIDGMMWSLAEYGRCSLGDFEIVLCLLANDV